MKKQEPLLSIVIPTRNRVKYAINAIKQILSIPSDKLELVIQDNSDSRELEEFVKSNSHDSRLKYKYVSDVLSFVGNFSQAISRASGEYLCIIGDDDGVNPEIMLAVEWAKSNNVGAITPGLQAQYLWPGVDLTSITRRMIGGTLSIGKITGHVRIYNPKKELSKLMINGGQKYYTLGLPKLYHGIVKREFMERVKEKTGDYFGGLTPDIYAAVALATVVDKVISIDYPLTIPGASLKSGSIDSVTGKHIGKLEEAPHFRGRRGYKWADEVPRFYSVETIWADSAISALKDTKHLEMLAHFNIERLAAYCLIKHFSYAPEIFRGMYFALRKRKRSLIIGSLKLPIEICRGPGRVLFNRGLAKIRRIFETDSIIRFTGINNISDASATLSDYLHHQGLSFRNIIERVTI